MQLPHMPFLKGYPMRSRASFVSPSYLVVLVISMQPAISSHAQTGNDSRMPIYVTPFYNSKDLKVSVGAYSERMAQADNAAILKISQELKKEKDSLRAEVMYVAAIRLYDLGHKDEAVYWFYTAQYRGRLFTGILDKQKIGSLGSEAFELKQAYVAFNQLAGSFINKYAFGDLTKLEATLATVVEEGKTLPKFTEVYPNVQFQPSDAWADANSETNKGLLTLIEYIKSNAESIKEQRKKNGIE